MENVDKIEVIKGPGASVYGADATGGVINIITRREAGIRREALTLPRVHGKTPVMQSIIPVPR